MVRCWVRRGAGLTRQRSVPPCACHDIPDQVEAAVEEVVGTGNDDNWQIKRVSPGKDIA